MNLDYRCLSDIKICAIWSATANAMKNRGIKADIVPKKFVTEFYMKNLCK